MDVRTILKKYIDPNSLLYSIVLEHSESVAKKSLNLAENHPEWKLDLAFLEEAALLHDVGVVQTYAPDIQCFGPFLYICHGYLGRAILEKEGLFRHALVCERHTGTGLYLPEILRLDLPLPHRDLAPVTLEEQLICFADKFFSKTAPGEEMDVAVVRFKLERYGEDVVNRFDTWVELFL